jgi:hypothetical protein
MSRNLVRVIISVAASLSVEAHWHLATAATTPPEQESRVSDTLPTQPIAPEPDPRPAQVNPEPFPAGRAQPQEQATATQDSSDHQSRADEVTSAQAPSSVARGDPDRNAQASKRERWETPLPPVGMMP